MCSFKGNGFCFPLGRRTYIMGILNITPDSFYDGGEYNTPERAVEHAIRLEREGADIIDVGANSTRPGAELLSAEKEAEIIKAFLPSIVNAVSVPVSVDTFYPEVAELSLNIGARIINDVSGRVSPEMTEIIGKYNAGLVVMHNPLFSSSEAGDYSTEGGAVNAVKAFFEKAEAELISAGISREQLLFDTGIGFSKSAEDNLEIIRKLSQLSHGRALLTALSNKRMTVVDENMTKEERLYSTVAADTLAIVGGTDFIRVHNVRQAKLAAEMADRIVR